MLKPALLVLEDGSVFRGRALGIEGASVGEVVFNTAMTGYQEILTDPSYARQIVTLTYPQIGNTGVNDEDVESDSVHAAGLVIRQAPRRASSWRMQMTLPEYLKAQGVVAITDVDTRRLTRLIREKGALAGCIAAGDGASEAEALAAAQAFPGLKGMDLAREVSRRDVGTWTQTSWVLGRGYGELTEVRYHVVAYDFGIKHNILRLLADRGCRVTLVPATTPASEVLALAPDGVFLSNGPGDPEPCGYAIEAIRELLEGEVPIFGICLGHQLLALASGAKTLKMSHGHHGANHPVKDVRDDRVIVSSQNHGFAVDADGLPNCLTTTHVSLFDGTLQGIRRTDRPALSFQGHPEASPGPEDCRYLFDEFITLMAERTGPANGRSPAEPGDA
ncbi:MAG: glutamine-hydrolyzing carbamoyl-phosphate synthase small subunit [Gammaproteobacteria bacterium]|nr:glutamine-hydrolyzing carbamoyl-phosphate synthase small subunit [Gammaproteobacteria bacterium]